MKNRRDMTPEEKKEARQYEKWVKKGRPRMFYDPARGVHGTRDGKPYVKERK